MDGTRHIYRRSWIDRRSTACLQRPTARPPPSILGSKGHVRSFCKGGGVFISAVERAGMTMVFYVTAEF